jgi:Ran GTPase-activating protein (RanGAP) involved in mRNA processing and transport
MSALPEEGVTIGTVHDVVIGCKAYEHGAYEGNKRFQLFLNQTTLDSASGVLEQWTSLDPPGRFLKSRRDGWLVVASNGEALKRINALLHKGPVRRSERNKEKASRTSDEQASGSDLWLPVSKPWKLLQDALKNMSKSTGFFFYAEDFGFAGAFAVAEALKRNSTVAAVEMGRCEIGSAGAEAMSKALIHNSTLVGLDLSDNGIGSAGAVAVAQALKLNSSLRELKLSRNEVGDVGAVAIMKSLEHNSSLAMMELDSNSIGVDGATAIAEALKGNSALEKLVLGDNNIGQDRGVALISDALRQNSTLKLLGLGSNQIGDKGAVAVAEAMKCNSALKTLLLSCNDIADGGAAAISGALCLNSTLDKLSLYGNCITDVGAVAFAETLRRNSSLTSLCLNSNDISGTGADVIIRSMKCNTTVTNLDLRGKGLPRIQYSYNIYIGRTWLGRRLALNVLLLRLQDPSDEREIPLIIQAANRRVRPVDQNQFILLKRLAIGVHWMRTVANAGYIFHLMRSKLAMLIDSTEVKAADGATLPPRGRKRAAPS